MVKNIYFDSKNYNLNLEYGLSFYEQYKSDQLIDVTLNNVQEDIYLFNKINPPNKVYYVSFVINVKSEVDDDILLNRIRKSIYGEKLNVVGIETYLNNHYFIFGTIDDRITIFSQREDDLREEQDIIDDLFTDSLKTINSCDSFFSCIIIRLKNGKRLVLSVFSHLIFSGNSIDRFACLVHGGDLHGYNGKYEIQNYKVKNIDKQISNIYSEKYNTVYFKSGRRTNNFEINHRVIEFKKEANQINEFIKGKGLDAFTFFSATYGILISRFSGEKNFLVGFPIEKRGKTIFSTQLNMMLLPVSVTDYSFDQIALDIKRKRFYLLTLKDYSTRQIVDILKEHQIIDDEYTTNIAMSYQKIDQTEQFDVIPIVEKEMEYQISLEIIEYDDRYSVIIKAQKKAVSDYTFNIFANLYEELVSQILNGNKVEFNNSFNISNVEKNPVQDLFIQDLFRDVVKKYPHKIALKYGNLSISYEELDKMSNRMGNLLIKKGICPDDIVVVCLKDSPNQIATILALWKIGAVYLPLDYSCPQKRVELIIETVNPSAIIVDKMFECNCQSLVLEQLENESHFCSENLIYNYNQRAYIIFTSGTSGTPKGVINSHQGVCELIVYSIKEYGFSTYDEGILLHSLAFDFSIWEILTSLLSGGTLCLLDIEKKFDLVEIYNIICEEKITNANFTPSAFAQFNSAG